MPSALRRRLARVSASAAPRALAAALGGFAALAAGPALAQDDDDEPFDGVEITDELNAPITTGTADQTDPANPLPANVRIANESGTNNDGSIILDASVEDGEPRNPVFDGVSAITINSSNSFTNENVIRITDALPSADGTEVVGVRALTDQIGGPSFILNEGIIEVVEDFTRDDDGIVRDANGDPILDGDGNPIIDPDDVDDGDDDGPLAEGFGRVGVLIEGAAAFEGDVISTSGSAIRVEGRDSTGVRVAAPLNGDLTLQGAVSALGDRTVAVDIQQAVSGDVLTQGSISATGEEARGLRVGGDVAGGVSVSGAVAATGFETTFASNFQDPDTLDEGEELPELDAEALDSGGEAVRVEASIGRGLLVNGPVLAFDPDNPEDDPDTPEDESENEDPRDLSVEFNTERPSGQITSTGSAPALRIQPGADGAGDIVIGLVEEEIRDNTDDDEDENTDEIVAVVTSDATFVIPAGDDAFDENAIVILIDEEDAYGLINRGTITGSGLNRGFTATAVDIRGSADGTRGVTIEGGFFNGGAISANAREADATAIVIGPNADVGRIENISTIEAAVLAEAPDAVDDPDTPFDDTVIETAAAIDIEAGASVTSFENRGIVTARAVGDHVNLVVVRDASGSLESFTNRNLIQAFFEPDGDDDDGDGDDEDADTDPDPDTGLIERPGQAIAVDLRGPNDGVGVTFTQDYLPLFDENGEAIVGDGNNDDVIDFDDVVRPVLIGDVYFGDTDDTFELLAGDVRGDLDFGLGQDVFSVIGRPELEDEDQPEFVGRITDPDGSLVIVVGDAVLEVTNASADDPVRASSLDLRDGGRLRISIDLSEDLATSDATQFVVSGEARFAPGATVTPEFVGLTRQSEAVIVAADSLVDQNGDPLSPEAAAALLGGDAPFIYNVDLTSDDGQTLTLSASLRTPEELGLNANQSSAYEPVIAAAITDDEAGTALANIGDEDPGEARSAFFEAYNQLLPDFSRASLELTQASVDGAFGAVANRLSALRGDNGALGGVWAQEYFVYLDRSASADNPGFRGEGFGVAFGVDRPIGPFYAAGLNFVFGASEFEEHTTRDDPTNITTFQLGAYASSQRGPFLLDFYGGAGINNTQSVRNVEFGAAGLGQLDRRARADWRSYVATGTARLGAEFDFGWAVLTPIVSGTYLYVREEGFKEEGAGALNLAVDPRTIEAGSAAAVLSIGRRFGRDEGTWWSPQLRVGYREDLAFDAPETLFRFVDDNGAPVLDPDTGVPLDAVLLTAADLPESAGLLGFTFAAGTDYSSFAFDVDADVRDGFTRYTSRFTFRFLF